MSVILCVKRICHKEKRAGCAFDGFDSPTDFVVTSQVSLDFSIFLHDTFAYQGKYLMWFFFLPTPLLWCVHPQPSDSHPRYFASSSSLPFSFFFISFFSVCRVSTFSMIIPCSLLGLLNFYVRDLTYTHARTISLSVSFFYYSLIHLHIYSFRESLEYSYSHFHTYS